MKYAKLFRFPGVRTGPDSSSALPRVSHRLTMTTSAKSEESKAVSPLEEKRIVPEEKRIVTPSSMKRERCHREEPALDVRAHARHGTTEIDTADDDVSAITEAADSKEIAEASMVKIVLEDLRSSSVRTLELAMKKLGQYLYGNGVEDVKDKQRAFYRVGGHVVVMRVMDEHPTRKILQVTGVGILMNASYKNYEIQTAVAKVKGIEAILAVMKAFPQEKVVIWSGFEALRNIVCAHEDNSDLLVTRLGGIPFLIGRMQEFQNDTDVMENACWMLKNLSCFEQLREPIANAKAVTTLGTAIEKHRDNAGIRKAAREAMKLLM